MGTTSLKAFIPGLARMLGTTAFALYERQRVLVATGVLPVEEGRGRGSGVRLSLGSVMILVLSVLGTDSLSESAARIGTLLEAKPAKGSKGFFAEREGLLYTLCLMLLAPEPDRHLHEIAVSKNTDRAWITVINERGDLETIEFLGTNATKPPIERLARMEGAVLRQIADDVQEIECELTKEERLRREEGER